jgi:hypothetical protein
LEKVDAVGVEVGIAVGSREIVGIFVGRKVIVGIRVGAVLGSGLDLNK